MSAMTREKILAAVPDVVETTLLPYQIQIHIQGGSSDYAGKTS